MAQRAKPHIQDLLDLQHVTLAEEVEVWLVDIDGDISGTDGGPVRGVMSWDEATGWVAQYDSDQAISNL